MAFGKAFGFPMKDHGSKPRKRHSVKSRSRGTAPRLRSDTSFQVW